MVRTQTGSRLGLASMKRALPLFLLVGPVCLSSQSAADAPHKEEFVFVQTTEIPAGELCDFAYRRDVSVAGTHTEYVDSEGRIRRTSEIGTASITHTNTNTGDFLTETIRTRLTFDETTRVLKIVGQNWHLRDPEGKLVHTRAGQLRLDPFEGEIIKATPNFGGGLADICELLGGRPA